ncbi:MAG: hypothetical protein O9294_11890 [Cytophagales bacterium]|nr:hypothetical protein [Cytophagales bacterium]
MKKKNEEKIKVRATKNGALYIDVVELFSLKKVQDIIAKAVHVKVNIPKESKPSKD